MASYRQEATIRIAYFTGAFVIAVAIGSAVSALVAETYYNHNLQLYHQVVFYSGLAVFAVACGILVYFIDQMLNERFNQNP